MWLMRLANPRATHPAPPSSDPRATYPAPGPPAPIRVPPIQSSSAGWHADLSWRPAGWQVCVDAEKPDHRQRESSGPCIDEFGLYEFGRWQQPLPWPFFFDGEKERMTQKASVNGSYSHGLAFAFHSIAFSKHACTIQILFTKLVVACHGRNSH